MTINKYFTGEKLQWTYEPTFKKYQGIGTDDWDSLLSGCGLKEVKGLEVNKFFNFKQMYAINPNDDRPDIGIDMARKFGMTYCNHMQLFYSNSNVNKQSANLNNIKGIHNKDYYKKYPLSTFLLICSMYDIPLDYNNKGLIKFLLAVDSSYKGFYAKNSYFKQIYVDWMEELGFTKMLDILAKTDVKEFNDEDEGWLAIIKNRGDKLYIDDNGFMQFGNYDLDKMSRNLGFKVELPKEQFTLIEEYDRKFFTMDELRDLSKNDNVYSYALTYKGKGVVSYFK